MLPELRAASRMMCLRSTGGYSVAEADEECFQPGVLLISAPVGFWKAERSSCFSAAPGVECLTANRTGFI